MTWARRVESALLRSLPQSVQARLGLASAENRAIVRGMFWVATFLLAAKGIAAVKEVLVAHHYGTSALVDGYLFAFNLASWPISVFYSVISFVLIPFLVRLRSLPNADATGFAAQLHAATWLLAGLLTLATALLLPRLINAPWLGLGQTATHAALQAVPYVAAMVFFGVLAALYSTWLMSRQRHANTFLEAMPALAMVLLLLVWPWSGAAATLAPLLLGTVLGFGVQAALLAALTRHDAPRPAWRFDSPHWTALRQGLGVMAVAQIVFTSATLIDQFLLARLPEGSLASFGYAQRVMALVLGLTALVLGRAMLPVFAGVADASQRWQLARRWAGRMFWAGCLGFALMAWLAEPLVRLLFEHGAFTPADTAQVSLILTVLAAQLPFYLAATVLVQWVGASQQFNILLLAACVGFATKLLAGFWLLPWGAVGVAGATLVMYVSTVLAIVVSFKLFKFRSI